MRTWQRGNNVLTVRRVAVEIAFAVGLEAQRAGVAPTTSPEDLHRRMHQSRWTPAYPANLAEILTAG